MAPETLLGRQLGPYQIESMIGSGGMATVYRATAPQNEVVALKVLFPPAGMAEELTARFEREAGMAARLNHPAIVPVHDVGRSDGRAYMAMDLIAGESLEARLRHSAPITEALAADIAWQIADALDYAHSQGVVHRDVKPANILLTLDNRALLTDFGVALALDAPALTRTGYIVGTPAYISPEQAGGATPVDGRADLYALGVVLYEMVTGHTPFEGSTPKVLHAHVYEAPPAPSAIANVSPTIENIILHALAKDAARRYQSGAEMAQTLAKLGPPSLTRTALQPSPTRTLPPTPQPQQALAAPSVTTPHLQKSVNPFFYGGAVSPELFYGREELLKTTVQRLSTRLPQSVSIVGERRMGKSSLLNYIQANAERFFPPRTIIIYLDLMKAYSHSRVGLMKALRRALTRAWREPWSPDEDDDLIAFDFALEELQAEGVRLLLFLDEVENLTARATEFNDVLEDWRACAQLGQMAILAASAQPLADLCATGGLTSPFYNIFSQHRLGLLEKESWQALVLDHLSVTEEDMAFIQKVADGHPFMTQLTASYLWEARSRGGVDYERLYQELWFQLQPHLQHLWRNLTPAEQTILRQISAGEAVSASANLLAALARRGIAMAQGRPFSHLFAEMIRAGQLES